MVERGHYSTVSGCSCQQRTKDSRGRFKSLGVSAVWTALAARKEGERGVSHGHVGQVRSWGNPSTHDTNPSCEISKELRPHKLSHLTLREFAVQSFPQTNDSLPVWMSFRGCSQETNTIYSPWFKNKFILRNIHDNSAKNILGLWRMGLFLTTVQKQQILRFGE